MASRKRGGRWPGILGVGAVLALASGEGAQAEMPLYEEGDFSAGLALGAGAGVFSAPEANFGLGSYKVGSGERIAHSPTWGEGFLKPELKLGYRIGENGKVFGDVSAVASATLGQGEGNLYSGTWGNPMRVDLEEAYVGYQDAMPFGDAGDTAVLTLGRQAFTVGDNFLIGQGTYCEGQRGDFWLAPRYAFNGIGTVKLNADPVRADIFALQNTVDQRLTRHLDQPRTSFAGLNVEYFLNSGGDTDGRTSFAGRRFYVGAMYFNIYDADDGANASGAFTNAGVPGAGFLSPYADRDGMNVFDVHLGGNPFDEGSALADVSLYADWVRELNGTAGRKANANAYYVEPAYTFSGLRGQPKLTYRYAHFSGDRDPVANAGGTRHGFDPLFYSAGPRGYGSWYQGEITGQYFLFNSNEDVHMVSAAVNLTDEVKVTAFYYRFLLDRSGGLGISSRHFDDEVNLVGEYAYSPNASFALVAGAAKAADAARAYLGHLADGRSISDKTYTLEASVFVNF